MMWHAMIYDPYYLFINDSAINYYLIGGEQKYIITPLSLPLLFLFVNM